MANNILVHNKKTTITQDEHRVISMYPLLRNDIKIMFNADLIEKRHLYLFDYARYTNSS